jgi:hypothetical protein
VDEIIAIATSVNPAVILNVVAEAAAPVHGDTVDNPTEAASTRSTTVKAAAATPPARMAAHETADISAVAFGEMGVGMMISQQRNKCWIRSCQGI